MMEQMQHLVAGYVVNALWQVPLVFAAAWVAGRLLRKERPVLAHRIWVAALLLEVGLPACPFDLATLQAAVSRLTQGMLPGAGGTGRVAVEQSAGAAVGGGGFSLSPGLLQAIFGLFTAVLLLSVGRLLWRLWQVRVLRRSAHAFSLMPAEMQRWERTAGGVALPEFAVTAGVTSPATLGVRQPLLLVPVGFLAGVNEADLDAVFAHEAVHLARHDFARHLLYDVLALPVAWHPAMWATRRHIAETREMICDERAAARLSGHECYADSLFRLALMLHGGLTRAGIPAKPPHAIGILDANTLERRIIMLTEPKLPRHTLRTVSRLAACGLIAVATCGSALALRFHVTGPLRVLHAQLKVPAEVMAGEVIDKKTPVYPQEAKANPVDGQVILHAIIGKDGRVEKLTILKSLRKEYDQSALTAVQQWTYKPHLVNGEPTAVDTTITVTYSRSS